MPSFTESEGALCWLCTEIGVYILFQKLRMIFTDSYKETRFISALVFAAVCWVSVETCPPGVPEFTKITLQLLEQCVTFHHTRMNKGWITFLTSEFISMNSFPCGKNCPDRAGNRVHLCGNPEKRISFQRYESLVIHETSVNDNVGNSIWRE
jgi:hypothetical protein